MYWTEEKIMGLCQGLVDGGYTISELYNNYQSTAMAAKRLGLMDRIKKMFPKVRHEANYWTEERVIAFVKKCKTIKELVDKSEYVYKLCLEKGFDNILSTLENNSLYGDNKVDSVYAYFFTEYNAVYVGRTLMKHKHKRHLQHCAELVHKKPNNSSVFKFAKSNNCQIPQMTTLEENLTIEEGRTREDYFVKYFQSKGMTILNVAKTGSYSGSLGRINCNKYNVNKALEEIKQYDGYTHTTIQGK